MAVKKRKKSSKEKPTKVKNVKEKTFGFQKMFVAFIFIFEVILIFTFFDFIIHSLSSEYTVPNWYFTNKIIYGTIIGFIAYLFIKNKPIMQKSLILSAVIAVLLQIKYYLQGYDTEFVLVFLAIHFTILFLVSYIGLKITKM